MNKLKKYLQQGGIKKDATSVQNNNYYKIDNSISPYKKNYKIIQEEIDYNNRTNRITNRAGYVSDVLSFIPHPVAQGASYLLGLPSSLQSINKPKDEMDKFAGYTGLIPLPLASKKLKPFKSYNKIVNSLNLYGTANDIIERQTGGLSNNLTIVEDGEYIRDNQGKVGKITNIPTHDDNELIIDNQVQKVPKGKAGQGIYNVESVLSASHENRNQSDDTYTQADEEIKIKPEQALQLAEQLNLNIKRPLSSISPSKLMDKLLESREKLVSKYKNIDKEIKSERQANSFTSNVAVLNSIPAPEDIYDFVFSNQENSKSEVNNKMMQTGGRLQQFPTMDGSKPVALVNTSQGVKKVNMIDNRTISMDDMFNKDSVQIQGNKATIIKKNPLKKFIK